MGCTPNTTTCTGDQLTVCGSNGTIERTETCKLGCAPAGNRCLNVDPSNGLAAELDAAGSGPDAVFTTSTMDTVFNTDTGDVTHNGAPFTVPSVVHNQGAGLPPIRVFQFKSLIVRTKIKATGANAIALVSLGDVEIAATIELAGRLNLAGPGAITAASPCQGQDNNTAADTTGTRVPGAGGGGLGTAGGRGGNATKIGGPSSAGAAGGAIAGSVNLEPLRGGCRGGNISSSDPYWVNQGGGGGGALQISSRTRITVTSAGIIDAGGGGATYGKSGAGGGSGGAILLEAPEVVVDGTLAANGGAGTCFNWSGEDGQIAYRNGSLEALGGNCTEANGIGDGGNGGSKDRPPLDGGNGAHSSSVPIGGGGGGAVGRIRVNTKAGTFTKGAMSLVSPIASESSIRTR